MIILERDGSLHHYPPDQRRPERALAELPVADAGDYPPQRLIDRIIGFAFDKLGVSQLEVRVYEQ